MKRILVACEESQAVTIEFRKLGFEAYSCDIQECSGGHPEWHILGDAIEVAYGEKWDLMIAHPPCTYLSKAGARWMFQGGAINNERLMNAQKAKDFFMALWQAPINKIAIENPLPLRIVMLPKPTTTIQPYEFGDPYSKKTLLWLKNLPPLMPTIFSHHTPFLPSNTGGGKRGQKATFRSISQKDSSKTFAGIAKAMAEQWGSYLLKNPQ